MHNKLQELTEKIYNEGVNKANQEAEEIKANAKKQAEKIVKDAKEEAQKITEDAKKKSQELKSKVESELKQASGQTLRSIKQEVTNMITAKAVDKEMKQAFDDNDFIKKVIEAAIKNWSADNPQMDLKLLLPEKKQKELESYFKSNASKMMKSGLEVVVDPSVKAGFKIGPADGSYQISFKEEDFENLFKSFLKPKTIELLFAKK